MTLQELYQEKYRIYQIIQSMNDRQVISFDDWVNIHAEYGDILFEIRKIENPLKEIVS
jgi:hypothetical protein